MNELINMSLSHLRVGVNKILDLSTFLTTVALTDYKENKKKRKWASILLSFYVKSAKIKKKQHTQPFIICLNTLQKFSYSLGIWAGHVAFCQEVCVFSL